MGSKVIARLLLIITLALGLAPGTWLRSPVVQGLDHPITLHAVDEPGEDPPPGWSLEGLWEYKGDGLLFGGYSALLPLDDARMIAFSDRGGRFTFLQPDQPQGPIPTAQRAIAEQSVDPAYQTVLFDIESATSDPATGQYWLGFEYTHGFQRYGPASEGQASEGQAGEGQGVRLIDDEVEWTGNSGAEAMARLADGRFLVFDEPGLEALIFPRDPVEGGEPVPVTFNAPPGKFSITDAAELPDGRILMVMRRVAWGVPPFETRLGIAEWSGDADKPVLNGEIALDLSAVAPPDNYEGIALRKREDGALDVWVISDDNLSIMQRTLVLKLRFDPQQAARAKQKAPE